MVGYITVAHGGAQRLSEKWRHFVVHCLYSLFCTSPRCVGVQRPTRSCEGLSPGKRNPVVGLYSQVRSPAGCPSTVPGSDPDVPP